MMKSLKLPCLLVVGIFLLPGCAAQMAKFATDQATMAYTTAIHKALISLPAPEQKIPVAVYKFRDQTGQYKPHPTAASFSTSVTQGATSMLIKALEDSGWFVVIERESLPNLLTERKIVRQTREGFLKEDQKNNLDPLPPLMYAAIMLEGGIISYDTDLITGGFGVKYFGVGGSTQIRSDQLSIYLRAISIKNGLVLKSVSTTKTVLSREVDFGIFRFVRYKQLLEAEAGLSTNEPAQMCVLEATEKAVYDLIIEGILSGLWRLKNPEEIQSPAIQQYLKEKEEVEVRFDEKGYVRKSDIVTTNISKK
jgi:curli production assembly/transport component CsgG